MMNIVLFVDKLIIWWLEISSQRPGQLTIDETVSKNGENHIFGNTVETKTAMNENYIGL